MDHTRLAYFRRALRANGYDDKTIAMVEKSWQPGTVKGYESYWRRWRAFASSRGQDPAARNDAELTNWLSTLVENELKEGSLDIARTAVTTLWDYVDDMPGVITARITKTVKKQNGAKSNGRSDVWDLPYLF